MAFSDIHVLSSLPRPLPPPLPPSLPPPPPRWIEACIEDELPPTTELEQALRNGVILCRLGHYYAPEVLPVKRIYDLDEAKYRVRKLRGQSAQMCVHMHVG